MYDNLGLEPIWRAFHQWAIPRLRRAVNIGAEQVGTIRNRWLIERFRSTDPSSRLDGTLWAIGTQIEDGQLEDAIGFGKDSRVRFPGIRTHVNALTFAERTGLTNHGYSLADAGLRFHLQENCRISAFD